MRKRLLTDQVDIKALADRLSKCSEVTKYDQGEEKEGGVLAHCFGDLEESFETFLNDQLPRLMDEQAKGSELCDILLEIGEELRHILYHIHDPKFYQYLRSEKDG